MKSVPNMIMYKAREGSRIVRDDETAQAVGEELEALARSLGMPFGAVPSTAIVEMARDKSTVSNKQFQWDDSIAGQNWRIEQASRLKQSIVVVVTTSGGETVSIPAFPSVTVTTTAHAGTDDEGSSERYAIPVQNVLDDTTLRAEYARKTFSRVYAYREQLLAASPQFTKLVKEMDRLNVAIAKGALTEDAAG